MAQLPFSFTSSQLKWFKNVTFLKVKAKMWKNLRGGSYLNTLTISSSFFSLKININFIGELTECIKTDKEFFHHNWWKVWLHVKLFFKGCPIALSQWFRQGTDCCLTRKSMLENFPVYLRNYADNYSSIFEESLQYRLTKKKDIVCC